MALIELLQSLNTKNYMVERLRGLINSKTGFNDSLVILSEDFGSESLMEAGLHPDLKNMFSMTGMFAEKESQKSKQRKGDFFST